MRWEHDCSLTWLRERQLYLTASDIKDLLPFTATGKPRKITDEHRIKVLARKNVNLTNDDCHSAGAAARGHILEPYAIEKFNLLEGMPKLHHWDDALITSERRDSFLAFSPDACNIEQTDSDVVVHYADTLNIEMIGEVKSYSPERHMLAGFTPKDKLEERWQIATAMAVCNTIRRAYLIFFNPSMKMTMIIVEYSRQDLEDEIETIKKIDSDWFDFIHLQGNMMSPHKIYLTDGKMEEDIVFDLEQHNKLNP